MTKNKVPSYDKIFRDLSIIEYEDRFSGSPSKWRFDASNLANYKHLIWTFINNFNFQNPLLISALPHPVVHSIPFMLEKNYEKHKLNNVGENLQPSKKEYDFIYAEFPMEGFSKNLRSQIKNQYGFLAPAEWFSIFNCVKYLSKNGCALAPVMPVFFFTYKSKKFLQFLSENCLHVNAIFEIPAIYSPKTKLRPYLISIKRNSSPTYFIGNAENVEAHQNLVENLLREKDSDNLFGGTYVQKNNFISFSKYRADLKLDEFKKKFAEFNHVTIGDLALSINQAKHGGRFVEKENAVYFPIVGNSDVACKLEDCTKKHWNYFQIELSESVLAGYFCYIFKSKLGQAIRDTLKVGMFVEHVPKQFLEATRIPLPNLTAQKETLNTYKKVQSLQRQLALIEDELSVNPLDHRYLDDQIDKSLAALNLESGAERIRRIVLDGESKTLEFKETLGLDVREQNKNKDLVKSCLKTIVGFLNTDGGELLIGVHDNGNLIGMELEIRKFHKNSRDTFLLHFKDLIKDHIGEDFYPFVEYQFIKIGGHCHVLSVQCCRSLNPCYYDNKEFYVRTNPSTDRLEGQKLVKYAITRFGKNLV